MFHVKHYICDNIRWQTAKKQYGDGKQHDIKKRHVSRGTCLFYAQVCG